MGTFSIWHWLVVLVIVLLLFGAGKIPKLAGDMAKGIKAFKSGLKDEDESQSRSGETKAIEGEKVVHTANASAQKDEAAKH
ncbi:twin-arginine translocase TatA/TatE family subunit [Telmatospirillum sp. J64-1]|uniref:twin-arginine translocase TatA/TatE family subunit n=1 Tax=Telmatospirillum sp. J64-1 TaxID=2502183 RepID=UPI00115DD48A